MLFKVGGRSLTFRADLGITLSSSATASGGSYRGVSANLDGSASCPLASARWHVETVGGDTPITHVYVSGYLDTLLGSTAIPSTLVALADLAGPNYLLVTCALDLCIEPTFPDPAVDELSKFWHRIEDSPPNTELGIYQVPTPGASFTAELHLAGLSATVTGTVGASPANLGYAVGIALDGLVGCAASSPSPSFPMSAACDLSATVDIVTNSFSPTSVSGTSSAASTSVSTSSTSANPSGVSIALSCAAASGGVGGSGATGTASNGHSGDRALDAAGIIAQGYNAPPALAAVPVNSDYFLVVDIEGADVPTLDTTGTWNRGIVQKKANYATLAGATALGEADASDSDTNAIDTYSPYSAAITAASLSANGDDPQAMRHAFRGKAVTVATVTQDGVVNVDNGDATTVSAGDFAGGWSASGTGWGVSSTGGDLHFSGTADGGSVTRTFSAGKGFLAGYRYLRLHIGADAPATVKVRIQSIGGEKLWTVPIASAGAAANRYIDMMLPENLHPDYDATNTRYPEDASEYPAEGPLYGIGRAASIEMYGLPGGVAFTLKSVDLVRWSLTSGFTDYNQADNVFAIESLGHMIEWKPENVVSGGGTSTRYYQNRGLIFQQDATGNSLEEGALQKAVTVGGVTGTTNIVYSFPTLADIAARAVRRYPGFHLVSSVVSTPSGAAHPPAEYEYYNIDNMLLSYVWGNGLRAVAGTGSSYPNNTSWLIGSGRSVADIGVVQPIYDRLVDWPPLAGNMDIFALSTATGANRSLTIRHGTILRTALYGEVALEEPTPDPVNVRVNQPGASGALRGTNAISTTRWYETQNPGVRLGAAVATMQPVDTNLVSLSTGYDAYTRLLQRIVWAAATGSGFSADTSATGQTAWARKVSGLILTGWSMDWATTLWLERATGKSGSRPCIRFDTSDAAGRVYLLYEAGGGAVALVWSDDSGRAWSVSTTIWASGAGRPGGDVSASGWLLASARTSGGAAQVKAIDRTGAILFTATAVASGVANDNVPLTWDKDAQRWYLLYLDGAGAIQRVESADDGRTWS